MQIHLLGTNGWYDNHSGSTPCVLVQTQEFDIIFDAGYGFAKVDQFVTGEKPTFLFLSHFHYDHLIGLHTLAKNHFKHGLRIFGLPGIEETMLRFFDPTFTIPLNKLSFPVTFEELSGTSTNLPFTITSRPLIHNGPCQGYRLEVDQHVMTYCTDTGYCVNAVELAKNTDLLLAECTVAPGTEANPIWPHLSPALAAKIALEAEAQRLILIHFDATSGPEIRDAAEIEAQQIFLPSSAGRDGMVIDL